MLTFELQVDDSCDAGKLQTCQFASPEWTASVSVNEVAPDDTLPVSERAPVGSRYYWRVRSCTSAACSRWSTVRYVDVGRQRSDFDGDGYADVILPGEGSSVEQGRVLVGFGPAPSSRTVVLKAKVSPQTADHFGQFAVAIGDLDADGFGDLLVTAPGDQQKLPGIAYVFFGRSDFADKWNQGSVIVRGEGDDRIAGVAVATGDVDADGQQDFVLDSYPSGPRLYRGVGRILSATPLAIGSKRSFYGSSAGDVTGDGYADLLAVSGVNDGSFSTTYSLMRGGPKGFGTPTSLSEGPAQPSTSWTIAGDLNRDGFSDLGGTVSYPGDISLNRIDIAWGAETPLVDEPDASWGGGLQGNYADFGGALAAGDVNGDGFEDAVAGVAWHTSDVVQGNLYFGGLGSREASDAVYAFQTGTVLFISQGVISGPGDVNGDGFDDVLLVEDFGHTGRLFFGSRTPNTTLHDNLHLPPP